MLSHYFIALGSLPQQKATGTKKSSAYWVPSTPTPGIDRGKYRYLDGPCS